MADGNESDYIPTVVGAAAAGSSGIVLRFRRGSLQGCEQRFQPGVVTIGRQPECDLTFDQQSDSLVSGQHARLSFEDGAWWLQDLNSTNGTALNRSALTAPARLTSGDIVDLGDGEGAVSFQIEIDGQPTPSDDGGDAEPSGETGAFQYRCPDCGASNNATYAMVGQPAACRACGASRAVPPPAISPFQGGSTPGTQGAPAADDRGMPPRPGASGDWNLVGKLKRLYRQFRKKRDVQQAITEAESRRGPLVPRADQACAALAEAMWRTEGVDWGDLQEARAVTAAEAEVADAERGVASAEQEMAEEERAWQTWIASWQDGHEPLERRAAEARNEQSATGERVVETEKSLQALLADRLAELETLSSRLVEFTETARRDPPDDIEAKFRQIGVDLESHRSELQAGIDGLEEAVSARRDARAAADLAAGEMRDAEAALTESSRTRAERETARQDAVRQGRSGLDTARQRVQAARTAYPALFAQLGRAIVASDMPAASSFSEMTAARAATDELRHVELELAELRHRLSDFD